MPETSKAGGLKSAWELAMERMGGDESSSRNLSDAQKNDMARIDQTAKAKIAEIEIMAKSRVAEADSDPEAVEKVVAEKNADIKRIQEKAELEKEKIRRSAKEA